MKLGYCRVSTKDQTTEQQEQALKEAGCERIFTETASGSKKDRPELARLLDHAREGDTIMVWKLDRLARSMTHLLDLAAEFSERKIELVSLTDSIDTTTASGKLHFHMLAALAEFERSLLRERVKIGLERARAEGKRGGRPKADEKKVRIAKTLIAGGMSISKAAKEAGVSRATLHRAGIVAKLKNGRANGNGSFEAGFETTDRDVSVSNPLH